MKKIFAVLLLSSFSYALEAPYLISATALSDSSVQLAWRNNDITTVGFIIQRKDSTDATFKTIDSVKSATVTSYTDSKNLQPQTVYTYQMLAYDATSVSVASNAQQATTSARVEIFKKPSIKVNWDFDTSKSVRVTIFDSSNCETGYRAFRDEGFSGSFGRLAEIISVNPGRRDSIVWYDSTIAVNTWYNFKVAVFKSNDSIYSEACSTYTFQGIQPKQVVRLEKLGEVPVSATIWSAQAGDSIICKENPSPDGKFSVINVKDSKHPKFEGYLDSTSLLSYPLQTLLPVFMKYGVSNSYTKRNVIQCKDIMLVLKDSIISMHKIQNNNMAFIDSFRIIKNGDLETKILLLSDTILVVQFNRKDNSSSTTVFLIPIFPSPSGFGNLPEIEIGYDHYRPSSSNYSWPYIHGYYNKNVIISQDGIKGGTGLPPTIYWHNLLIYDSYLNRRVELPGNMPYANAYNTGLYISALDNLCTYDYMSSPHGQSENVPTELFVCNVLNPYSRTFDSLNNAIYRDTVHTQNQLQNILLDTLNKRVFLIFDNNLTVLGYSNAPVGVSYQPDKSPSTVKHFTFLTSPFSRGVTIVLPFTRRPSDLFFYDLSGRLIDKMAGVTSNAVLWRPKARTTGCYFVFVKSGGVRFVERFIVR